jgi:hypothetical protein
MFMSAQFNPCPKRCEGGGGVGGGGAGTGAGGGGRGGGDGEKKGRRLWRIADVSAWQGIRHTYVAAATGGNAPRKWVMGYKLDSAHSSERGIQRLKTRSVQRQQD